MTTTQTVCQICKKAWAQHRCPSCGKLICPDCSAAGVCSICAATRAVVNRSGGINLAAALMGVMFGLFLSLLAVIVGGFIYGVTRDEDARTFGKYSTYTGVVVLSIAMIIWGFGVAKLMVEFFSKLPAS